MADILNENWVNIQEPVREMFIALSKGQRVLAGSIKDLDVKQSTLSKELAAEFGRALRQLQERSCSKDDGTHMLMELSRKANEDSLSELREEIHKATKSIASLREDLKQKDEKISSLNTHVQDMESYIARIEEKLSSHTQHIHQFVEQQTKHLRSDVEVSCGSVRLFCKEHMEAMDHTYMQQVERECIRPLKELNAIVSDVCVRRDEWEAAMNEKADKKELLRMGADSTEKAYRSELKPLQAAVGNLQQSLQQQEVIHTQKTSQLFEQLHKLEDRIKSDRFKREINEGNVLNDMAKVEAVVDGVINSRGLGKIDQLSVDIALSKNNEYLLQQMRTIGETLRFEIVSDNKEEFNSWRRNLEEKIEKIRKANEDNSEKQAILKLSLAELSEEIAKSLAKKLDRKEFKANATKDNIRPMIQYRKVSVDQPNLYEDESHKEEKRETEIEQFDSLILSLKKKKDSDLGQPTPIANNIHPGSIRQPDFSAKDNRNSNSATNSGNVAVSSSFNKEDRGRLTDVSRRIEELEKKFAATEKDKPTSSILKSPAAASPGIPQWQLAVGDLTLRLRDEIQRTHEKEKEYLTQLLQDALLSRDKKITTIQSTLAGCALQPTLTSLDKEVVTLKSRVSGEILGARFLWTNNSSAPDREGWVPWDVQAVNASPNVILWSRLSTSILVRVPGLYRICVGVFTAAEVSVSIYLNDEPILLLQPHTSSCTSSTTSSAEGLPQRTPVIMKPIESYVLRRLRHSLGEVCCLCIDEIVSFPAEANIKVRLVVVGQAHAHIMLSDAQAFLSIKKI